MRWSLLTDNVLKKIDKLPTPSDRRLNRCSKPHTPYEFGGLVVCPKTVRHL